MTGSVSNDQRLVLVTGATGYVGGQLLKALEGTGHRLRCLTRRPQYLRPRMGEWTQVLEGDLLHPASLLRSMEGADTAYYLMHSMGSAGAFEEEERRAATGFAEVAREAGLRRIIYLGGLLEGQGLRAGAAATVGCRGEAPWAFVASVRGRRGQMRIERLADDHLRPARPSWFVLLVRTVPVA